MRTGVFCFGGVEMDDASAGPPAPTDRRYTQKEMWHAAERMLDVGVHAERCGFDSYWLTEHHFQYEGYEVVPNGILFGAILSQRTSRLRIGTMFNIVGQWHPLKLAEDFATLHNISGGRGILGVGRGTVPREAQSLGTQIGSFDNPDKAAADDLNRRQFDEAMEVVLAAFENEQFSYKGEIYEFPPPGIPDRGGFVETLTLVPRPLYPYEIWQAVTSPPTLELVPKKGWGAVFWLQHHSFIKRFWERYEEIHTEHHGALEQGEKRMLVLNVRIEDTHEAAVASARDGHDEFWKFLGPYGWSRGYMGEGGKPAAPGLIPTLEQSIENKTWIVGTPDEVAEGIAFYRDELGLENLTLFPNFPGDTYTTTEEQMSRYAEQVAPLLG
ncbi:MAG TPA: LLM class flavin-dependent oxidoreductase [Acidimicrobiales bacterium]|nr:LLM class flavin-dependent oxidoreductase [Acidimicrobiales bacterium]